MENSMKRLKVTLVMAVMVIAASHGATAVVHRVGGKQGWNPSVNYTVWSDAEHFYVGEWLLFNFDKRYYNVLEVNKTSYESCIDQGFIRNITKGGRDVYELTEARTYYFLSGGGYCWHGMKVIVNVEIAPPLAPTPAPANSHSPSVSSSSYASLILVLLITMVVSYWGRL